MYVGSGGNAVPTAWTAETIKRVFAKRTGVHLANIFGAGAAGILVRAPATVAPAPVTAAVAFPDIHVVGDTLGGVVIGDNPRGTFLFI